MTSKEKAEKLVNKYFRDSDLLVEDLTWIQAKECALIAVDEILLAITYADYYLSQVSFWEEVKEEIEKL